MKLVSVVAVAALALSGCTPDFVTQSEADVILRITRIVAQSGGGGAGSGSGDVLNSDVRTKGSVFNDNAELSVDLVPKNRNLSDAGPVNDVVLERYEVQYVRSDGRNIEGVDVPFRISGEINKLVHAAQETEVPFSIVVVRHQAKLEPPLNRLAGLGGAIVLTCFAEITIHGRTNTGRAVTATGSLQINFADFADS